MFTAKRLLAATVCCFILATGYLAYVIAERQTALQKVARYNEAWTVSQTLSEFMRLENSVSVHGLAPQEVAVDEIQLRLDIMYGRLDIFEQGTLRDFIAGDPRREEVVEGLKEALNALDADLKVPERLDIMLHLRRLALLDGPLTHLASAASDFGAARIADDQQNLIQLHLAYTGLAAGLILCGIALILLLLHRHRLLNRAHEEMRQLAGHLRDASQELQAHNQRLEYVARHDPLTELPNRILFREWLDQNHAVPTRDGLRLAALFLDLDGFKDVNDTLGHDVGDALLRSVADRLRAKLQESDLVCRLGGDEFAILTRVQDERDALALAGQLIDDILCPHYINHRAISIGTSVGVSLREVSVTPEELLKQADLALYEAKACGRGRSALFRSEMLTELHERISFEADLRRALSNGELQVHYQPQVNAATRQIEGFEALLRWKHPRRGQVPPSQFIPVAEQSGLIHELGIWVLQQACLDAAAWQRRLKVAVNLSPVQFHGKDMLKHIVKALRDSGLEPDRLELEITESILLEASDRNLQVLRSLKNLGVRLAMDDFGTGYSSLGNLRSFSFDRLKIDRCFVHDITRQPDALSIITLVIGMAKSLGMSTTAEGIETEEQYECLRILGCDQMQGYLFDSAMPLAALALQSSRQAGSAA